MIYQMISRVALNEETFNENMKYKFFIPSSFIGEFPVMRFIKITNGRDTEFGFYSTGNKILEES